MLNQNEFFQLAAEFKQEPDHGRQAADRMLEQVARDQVSKSPNLAKDEEELQLMVLARQFVRQGDSPSQIENWYTGVNQNLRDLEKDGADAYSLSKLADAVFVNQYRDASNSDIGGALNGSESLSAQLSKDHSSVQSDVWADQNKTLALEDFAIVDSKPLSAQCITRDRLLDEGIQHLVTAKQQGANTYFGERAAHRAYFHLQIAKLSVNMGTDTVRRLAWLMRTGA